MVEHVAVSYLTGALITAGLLWSGILQRGDGSRPPFYEHAVIVFGWPVLLPFMVYLLLHKR